MAVLDSKFSNFADGGDLAIDDIVVGLRGGINTRFSFQGVPNTYLPLAGGTMLGDIDMDSHSIFNLPAPSAGGDAANKTYVDTAISTALGSYLPLAGGTMTGAIDMGTNKITGLGTPTVSTDAATKAYADLMLPLAGGTMSGAIAMATFKITGMGNPTLAQDAATKFYVDAQVAAASPLTTKGDLWGYTTTNARLPVGTTDGQVLQVASGAAAGLSYSTATYPTTATSTGSFIYANGTNFVASTSLWPNTVGSAGKIVQSDGTTNGYSTPTWPTTGGTAGSVVISDGTNKINSTSLWVNSVGSAGKIIRSDGTTNTYSTSTFADTYLINTIPFAASANALSGATLTSILDTSIGNTQGNILYRNASAWVVLAPGTSGQFLQTLGAGANVQWAPAGTVTSITAATGITLTPNPITSSGTVGLTIPVVVSSGGTGLTAITAHYLPIGNGTSALTLLAPSATSGVPLISQGASADPAYGTAVVAGGGTGNTTFTAYSVICAGTTATGAFQNVSGVGTSGQVLQSNGAGALPTWATIPGATSAALTKGDDTNVTLTLGGAPTTALLTAASITAGWTGTLSLARGGTAANLTASNGGIVYSTASALAILAGTATAGQMLQSGASTTPAWSTTTYPATNAINTLLYASSANVMSALATANSGVLVTSAGGVPSISSTLPAFTTSSITFNPTTGGLVGTTTNDNTAAGKVGEYVESVIAAASAVTFTNTTNRDLTSISLTAGDWDVWGNITFSTVGGTAPSQLACWISSTSATTPDSSLIGQIALTVAGGVLAAGNGINAPMRRFSLSGTTTIYISGVSVATSGNATGCGRICARRRR